jgi:hypothetical protein
MRLDKVLMSERNLRISHIFLAGHGTSKGESLLIGDFLFSRSTIGEMTDGFQLVSEFLDTKVKVFLFGCSTFDGTSAEIDARADWFRRILKKKDLEVFGYQNRIDAKTSNFFWESDSTGLLVLSASMIFVGALKTAIEQKQFFALSFWLKAAKFLLLIPALAFGGYIFNAHIKHTQWMTFLREVIFYDHLGVRATFKGGKLAKKENFLGHDYFSEHFGK